MIIFKVLSPLNSLLAVYAQRILTAALELKRNDIARKYATVSVQAYKRYLPEGHPELTIRLHLAAVCRSFEDLLEEDF
uniref:14_3_3 domain-containing protein n=1 Tax=Heterorhabditis bacteriophora TaxID=37862 RepID=A0A1I7WG46_HETBA